MQRGIIRRASLRQVVLLVDTARAYGRGLVRGVARYNQEHGCWSVYFKPHALDAPPPPWLAQAGADGILARIGDRRMAQAIRACGVPAVDLRGVVPGLPFPFVGENNAAIAALAARHLLDRGFREFGFCGLPRGAHPYMDQLSDEFVACVAGVGHACSVFSATHGPRRGEPWERQQNRPAQWADQQKAIARWLASLPKPVAVMACHDDRALQVLDACRRRGILVPEEVAVISVDNDPYLCQLAIPPLTSIDANPEQIGYEAAAILDRMMDGEPVPKQPRLIAPGGVVTRRSTDILAIENRHVAQAVRMIHERACEGVLARDVAAEMPLSRTLFGQQFKQAVGRTIGQELRRVRIERAKDLLSQTDLPIKQIAHRTGFRGVEYLTRVFGHVLGQTPAAYRRSLRK